MEKIVKFFKKLFGVKDTKKITTVIAPKTIIKPVITKSVIEFISEPAILVEKPIEVIPEIKVIPEVKIEIPEVKTKTVFISPVVFTRKMDTNIVEAPKKKTIKKIAPKKVEVSKKKTTKKIVPKKVVKKKK